MKKTLKIIIPILIIALLGLFAIKKIKSRKIEIAKTPSAKLPVYTVKAVKIKKGSIYVTQQYLGIIEPDKSVNIASKFSGFINKVYVTENQVVKKGDLLVKIDDRDIKFQLKNLGNTKYSLKAQREALKAELKGALSRLEYLKNKFYRDKKLFEGKAISRENFDLSKTLYEEGKSRVATIRSNITAFNKKIKSINSQIAIQKNNLKYTNIYSDINGIVTKIFLHEGNIAMPGKPIMNIETTENYKILVNIPEKQAMSIKPHNKVIINFSDKPITSEIKKIYPKSNNNSLVTAEIRVKSLPKNIATNSYVNVKIFIKKISGLIVPIDSVLQLTNGTYLLNVENGKIKKILVKIITKNDKFAIVKGNIKAGIPVITAMENKLRLLSFGVKGKLNILTQ